MNFFNTKMSLLLLTQITYHQKKKDYSQNFFSALRLNIRSLSKNFGSFKELYTLLSFKFSIVYFSETFDTVDQNILLEKLEINGIVCKNFQWFKNYLENEEKTNLLLVKCGVPQGSI